MKNILLIVGLFSFFTSSAQGWELTMGDTGGNADNGHEIIQLADSSYAIVGQMNCDFSPNCHSFLANITLEGNLLWTKFVFEGVNSWIRRIIQDDQGDLIVAGDIREDPMLSMFIQKRTAQGEEIWTKVIDTLPDITRIGIVELLYDAVGNYLILGTVYNKVLGKEGVYLLSLDPLGNEIWSETYFFNWAARPKDAAIDKDGSIWLTGRIFDSQSLDQNYFVMKTTIQGQLLFDNEVNNINDQLGRAIITLDDDRVMLILFDLDDNENDLILKILDTSGQSISEKRVENHEVLEISTAKFNDGNILLLTHLDRFLHKLTLTGEVLWQFEVMGTDSLNSYLEDVKITKDGGYILCGSAIVSNADGRRVYVLKLDKNGNLVNTINIAEEILIPIEVYPNPASDYLILETGWWNENLIFELRDQLGRLILERRIDDYKLSVALEGFTEGAYFYMIREQGKIIKQGKVMIAK